MVETQRHRRDQAALSLEDISITEELAAFDGSNEDLSIWREGMSSDPVPTAEEQRALETYDPVMTGQMSWNQATQLAFGSEKTGKNYKTKLIRVWVKFGLRIDKLN